MKILLSNKVPHKEKSVQNKTFSILVSPLLIYTNRSKSNL